MRKRRNCIYDGIMSETHLSMSWKHALLSRYCDRGMLCTSALCSSGGRLVGECYSVAPCRRARMV